jgi:hypothetical protein
MKFIRLLFSSLAGVLACGALIAAPPPSAPKPADTEEAEINIENDRTSHRTRIRIENEFIDYTSGDALNSLTYSGSYAIGLHGRKDWQLTIDWPLVHYHAGPSSTTASATGMGDVELTFDHAFETSGKLRWNVGMKVRLDTAMEPQLGDGMYVLSPRAAVSWRLNPRVKLMAALQYNQSISEREGVIQRKTLDFKPGVEFDFPGRWYGYIEYAPKWDFAKGNNVGSFRNFAGSSLKFELGCAWGPDDRLVFTARYEMPLTESSRRGTYVFGVSYRFK